MKTMIATDVRIISCDNRYYTGSEVAIIFNRYNNVFGKFSLSCRIDVVKEVPNSFVEITEMIDKIFEFSSLIKALLGKYNKKFKDIEKQYDFFICRCPGILAYKFAKYARKHNKPYFAEAMGCAWDAYWNHGIFGKIAAPIVFSMMKRTMYNADYALYVTSEFLQKRYPCKNESVGASNVKIDNISNDILLSRLSKIEKMQPNQITIATTAAVDIRYKGQEYVIKAIPSLNKNGINVKYVLIGGGDQSFLKELAKKLGVENQVEFVGRKPMKEVFELLDNAEIYIQPSLQEGLPRSVIEAMSRGCFCIGANTAGIPELIDSRFIVRRKSITDIVKKVIEYSQMSAEERSEISKRNFEESKKYEESVLNERRNKYFEKIKESFNKEI